MMKQLLKKLQLAIAFVCLTGMVYAQNPTVTFDNIPAGIELTNHVFASGDELVFTIDNIADDNTTITANIRVYITGSTANNMKKLQTSFNIDATSSSSDTFYSFVESAGSNGAGFIKRVFTFTSLTPNTVGSGAGGDYVLNEEYDILVRLVGGSPSPDDTNSNPTTMTGIADSVSPPDVTITVAQTPTKINPGDGTLDQPLIFTIGNIPTADPVIAINSRSYNSDNAAFNGSGEVGQFPFGNFDLDETTADVDNANIKTESTTPSGGYFNRTFTIKNHGPISGATTSDVILAIRFVGGSAFSFDTTLTAGTGGNASNNSFALAASVDLDATLSSRNFSNISKSIYPIPATDILNISTDIKTETYKVVSILGNTIKEVKATGSLDVSDLSSGIYVLVTDSGIAKFVKQ